MSSAHKISFETELKKRTSQIQMSYNTIIRDIKPCIFREAVDFVKEQAGAVTKVLSKEHHRIINQYFVLRKDNEDKTEQIKDL